MNDLAAAAAVIIIIQVTIGSPSFLLDDAEERPCFVVPTFGYCAAAALLLLLLWRMGDDRIGDSTPLTPSEEKKTPLLMMVVLYVQ